MNSITTSSSSSLQKLSKNIEKGLVSIIVPVRYNADITRVCLDSIKTYTKVPYEIILVQEGIDQPDVNEYVEQIKNEIKVIVNEEPKGFSGAMNSGLKESVGEYYCFLNNDTVCTPKWLKEMMNGFKDEDVGLISPVFTEMDPRRVEKIEGDFEYVSDPLSMKGVCFLIPRKVIEKIGWWDERFGYEKDGSGIGGGGDDNDMSFRIANSNYKILIAKKSYIYHYGSMSYRIKYDNDDSKSKPLAVKNFKKFQEKHGLNKEKPNVMIAIPTLSGNINSDLAKTLSDWTHDGYMKMKWKAYKNLSPLDHARNVAVKDFLEEYWDYLCFIDDDIVPPPNTMFELLKADKDIIAPLCFNLKYDNGLFYPIPIAYRLNEKGEYYIHYGKDVEETDVITGGMYLVKREVYEKMDRPFSFTYRKNGEVGYSEDFVFGNKCKELGYKLYTHYNLPCKHFKTVDIKGINDLCMKIQQEK